MSISKVKNVIIALLIITTITFGITTVDLSEENSSKQNEIVEQAVEIARQNEKIKKISVDNQESSALVTSLQNELEEFKNNKVLYLGKFKITYYCCCEHCCGKNTGITASGAKVEEGVTVAADTSILPFGSQIYIDGMGWRTVQDRGGAIRGNVLDVYIPSHNDPMPFNSQYVDIWVVIK